jgi:hypothetical protein
MAHLIATTLAPIVLSKVGPHIIKHVPGLINNLLESKTSKTLLKNLVSQLGGGQQLRARLLPQSPRTPLQHKLLRTNAAKGESCEQASMSPNNDDNAQKYKEILIWQFKKTLINSNFFKNFDPMHQSFLLSDWSLPQNQKHFLHFLSYAITFINRVYRVTSESECLLCSFDAIANEKEKNEKYEQYMVYVYRNKKDFIHMLSVYFKVNLVLLTQLFDCLKLPCNPNLGMYNWDTNIFLLEQFKKLNRKSCAHFVDYHGIVYKEEDTCTLDLKLFKIIERYALAGVHLATFMYSTGEVIKPKHWCAVIVDLKQSCILFYNSLGHPHQFDKRLGHILNTQIEALNNSMGKELIRPVTMYTNEHRIQDKKCGLCGLFVWHFFEHMICDQNRRDNLLESFDQYIHHIANQGNNADEAFMKRVCKNVKIIKSHRASGVNSFLNRHKNANWEFDSHIDVESDKDLTPEQDIEFMDF